MKKWLWKGQTDQQGNDARGNFLVLPRAENWLDSVRKHPRHRLGDLVPNRVVALTDRLTLQVEDSAMQGAGIEKGDYVVVMPQPAYRDGDIVAFRLGSRTLVRRYFRALKRIRLESDPPGQATLIVEAHTPGFQILGRVVQLAREIPSSPKDTGKPG